LREEGVKINKPQKKGKKIHTGLVREKSKAKNKTREREDDDYLTKQTTPK